MRKQNKTKAKSRVIWRVHQPSSCLFSFKGKIRNGDDNGDKKCKKAGGVKKKNNNSTRASYFWVHFLSVNLCDYDIKFALATFWGLFETNLPFLWPSSLLKLVIFSALVLAAPFYCCNKGNGRRLEFMLHACFVSQVLYTVNIVMQNGAWCWSTNQEKCLASKPRSLSFNLTNLVSKHHCLLRSGRMCHFT